MLPRVQHTWGLCYHRDSKVVRVLVSAPYVFLIYYSPHLCRQAAHALGAGADGRVTGALRTFLYNSGAQDLGHSRRILASVLKSRRIEPRVLLSLQDCFRRADTMMTHLDGLTSQCHAFMFTNAQFEDWVRNEALLCSFHNSRPRGFEAFHEVAMSDVAEATSVTLPYLPGAQLKGPDQIVTARQAVRTATKAAESANELRRKLLKGVEDQQGAGAIGGLIWNRCDFALLHNFIGLFFRACLNAGPYAMNGTLRPELLQAYASSKPLKGSARFNLGHERASIRKALLHLANESACAEARMGVGNAAALRAIGKCEILIHGLRVAEKPIAEVRLAQPLPVSAENEARDVRDNMMQIFSPSMDQIRTDVLELADQDRDEGNTGALWYGLQLILRAIVEHERERLEHCYHCRDSQCRRPDLHWMTLQNVLEQAREGNKGRNAGKSASTQAISILLGLSLKLLQKNMPGYVGANSKHITTANLKIPVSGETLAADSTGSSQAQSTHWREEFLDDVLDATADFFPPELLPMRHLCSRAFVAPFLSGEFRPRTVAIPPSVMFEPAEEDFALLAAMRGLRGSSAFMPQSFLEPCVEASMAPCQVGFSPHSKAEVRLVHQAIFLAGSELSEGRSAVIVAGTGAGKTIAALQLRVGQGVGDNHKCMCDSAQDRAARRMLYHRVPADYLIQNTIEYTIGQFVAPSGIGKAVSGTFPSAETGSDFTSLMQKRKTRGTVEGDTTPRRRRTMAWRNRVVEDLSSMRNDRDRARARRNLLGEICRRHGPRAADFVEPIMADLWGSSTSAHVAQHCREPPNVNDWVLKTANDMTEMLEDNEGAWNVPVVPEAASSRPTGSASSHTPAEFRLDPPSATPFGIFHAAHVWPDGSWSTRSELLRMGRLDLVPVLQREKLNEHMTSSGPSPTPTRGPRCQMATHEVKRHVMVMKVPSCKCRCRAARGTFLPGNI